MASTSMVVAPRTVLVALATVLMGVPTTVSTTTCDVTQSGSNVVWIDDKSDDSVDNEVMLAMPMALNMSDEIGAVVVEMLILMVEWQRGC
eukprot:1165460-Lingulodinium_polyedra.AAC.1